MNADTDTLRDDLAFMKALVQAGDDSQRGLGQIYFWSGLIYGGQALLAAAQLFGLLPTGGLPGVIIGLGPTLVFLVVLVSFIWRNRKTPPTGMVAKAMGAVFGAVGMANLALVAAIGSVAVREKSITIWLIYPCAVFILQGAAWLAAYALRQRHWLLVVAGGWFLTGIAMALAIEKLGFYVLFIGLGMFSCMVVPGWAMMRTPKAA
ncbi:MAG: hypothetical protein ACHP7N_09275 [Caulobacterales bacterium]